MSIDSEINTLRVTIETLKKYGLDFDKALAKLTELEGLQYASEISQEYLSIKNSSTRLLDLICKGLKTEGKTEEWINSFCEYYNKNDLETQSLNPKNTVEPTIDSKLKIKVTFPNGNIICHKQVVKTFIETIERIGFNMVLNSNIKVHNHPLIIIGRCPDIKKYKAISNNLFIFVNTSTSQKFELLNRLNSILNLKLIIEYCNNTDIFVSKDRESNLSFPHRIYDRTKYRYNGIVYKKSNLPLAIIKDLNHSLQYSFVKLSEFLSSYKHTRNKLLCKVDEIKDPIRYNSKENDLITSIDGIKFAVSNQFGIKEITSFIDWARKLGFTIEPLSYYDSDSDSHNLEGRCLSDNSEDIVKITPNNTRECRL